MSDNIDFIFWDDNVEEAEAIYGDDHTEEDEDVHSDDWGDTESEEEEGFDDDERD
jgi:hypothetical protein